jgi:hypothetical protein
MDSLSASGSYSGVQNAYPIEGSYATSIFKGDLVTLTVAGVINKDTGTATATPIGIFNGCRYTDPTTGQLTFSNMWPASNAAADPVAYVVDDPKIKFRIQASGACAQNYLMANAAIVQGAGVTQFGTSTITLNQATAANTGTLPLKIVGFVDSNDSAVGDAFTDCICIFNTGHLLANTTGLALA